MKTYSILYAEEVPHYTSHEIQARSDKEAIQRAKTFDWSELPSDPDHHSAVLKRIVSMEEAETGRTLLEGEPLDEWFIDCGKRKQVIRDAAPEMLEALDLCEQAFSDLARTDDGTPSISALNMTRAILAKVTGSKR